MDPRALTSRWHPLSDAHRRALRFGRDPHFTILPRGDEWFVRGRKALVNREGNTQEALAAGDVVSSLDSCAPHFVFLGQKPRRNPVLERAIIERDTDGDWLVYADWLQQQGDPLGYAIVQCETFRVGSARPDFLFVRSLKISVRYCFWVDAEIDGRVFGWEELVAALLMFPQGRFLRTLKVIEPRRESHPLDELLLRWVRADRPTSLEQIELGDERWSSPRHGESRC